MCTHLHADHVGWNTRLLDGRWVPTFPRARYLFSARELEHWTAENAKSPIAAMVDSVLPIVAANRADLITSEHVLDNHLRMLPTPGHTPDHFAVRLGRGGDTAVLTGDLIHSPLQARYPELVDGLRQRPHPGRHHPPRLPGTLLRHPDTVLHRPLPRPLGGDIKRWGGGFRCEVVA